MFDYIYLYPNYIYQYINFNELIKKYVFFS